MIHRFIQLQVTDCDGLTIEGAGFQIKQDSETTYSATEVVKYNENIYHVASLDCEKYDVKVQASGYEEFELSIDLTEKSQLVSVIMNEQGGETISIGGLNYPYRKTYKIGVVARIEEADVQEWNSLLSACGVAECESKDFGEALDESDLYYKQVEFIDSSNNAQLPTVVDDLLASPFVEDAGVMLNDRMEASGILSNILFVKTAEVYDEEALLSLIGSGNFSFLRSDPFEETLYTVCYHKGSDYDLIDEINVLADKPEIEWIEPTFGGRVVAEAPPGVVPPALLPGDALVCRQYYLNVLRVPEAWACLNAINPNLAYGNADIAIAVCDSGISSTAEMVGPPRVQGTPNHQEFTGVVVGGTVTATVGNANKVYFIHDWNAQPMVWDNSATVTGRHGSAVTGIITAGTNGMDGTVGIAANTRLMSSRFPNGFGGGFNQRWADYWTYCAGLNPGWVAGAPYAAGETFRPLFGTAGNPGPGASVFNHSHNWSPVLPGVVNPMVNRNAWQRVTTLGRNRRGSLIFTSAGNTDQDTRNNTIPGFSIDNIWGEEVNVMSVAASSLDHRGIEVRMPDSNYSTTVDPGIDFCAPSRSNRNTPTMGPPLRYAVTTTHRTNTSGNLTGNQGNIAVIQNAPAAGTANIQLTAADFPNFPVGTNILVQSATHPSICELHQVGGTTPATNTITVNVNLNSTYVAGVDQITSIQGTTAYASNFGGTSSASPMAAGIAGLMITANPALSWLEIRNIMRTTTVPINLKYQGIRAGAPLTGRNRWLEIDNAGVQNPLVTTNYTLDLQGPYVSVSQALVPGCDLLTVGATAGFQVRQSVLIGAEGRLTSAIVAPVPVFAGGGVNDLTVVGLYTGPDAATTFVITVDAGGLTFTWQRDANPAVAAVPITTQPTLLQDGFTIQFGGLVHAAGDMWTINTSPVTEIQIDRGQEFANGDTIVIGKNPQTYLEVAAGANAAFIIVQSVDGFDVGDFISIGANGVGRITGFASDSGITTRADIQINFTYVGGGGPLGINASPIGTIVQIAPMQMEVGTISNIIGPIWTIALNSPATVPHALNTIVQRQGSEVRAIKAVHFAALEIDPIQNNHALNSDGIIPVSGGRRADYSHGFGYGRLDAYEAVKAAIAYDHSERDLHIRNFLGEDGVTNLTAQTTQSPDIWIRRANDLIGAPLTYSDDGPHQNPSHNIGLTSFAGAGLDDLTPDGSFTGPTLTTYTITIDGTGATDTFSWTDGTNNAAGVAITGAAQVIGGMGVQVRFGAITGHTLGDVWTLSADPTVQRWIYARVANLGNLPSFAPSVAANALAPNQVRFYVALNDGSTPISINEYPADNLGGYLLSSNTEGSFFLGTSNIMTPIPGGSDSLFSLQWPEINLPPRNTHTTTPLATPLRTFLLTEVVPHDGALMGTTPQTNNNMSYREILFADIDCHDGTGAALPNTITVDSFGNVVNTNFQIDIFATIASFKTETVEIDFIRQNDNGTDVVATLRDTSGGGVPNWQIVDSAGNTGTITWVTINNVNKPVVIGTAVDATDEQVGISVSGNFDVAKQHNKFTIHVKVNSALSGVVIAENEKDIQVVEAATQPTGFTPAIPKAKPESYTFTEMDQLVAQTDDQAYGPAPLALVHDLWRATSRFTSANANLKAFAITDSLVMVQPVTGHADKVNLILKPVKQAGLDFTPVKYYIYRGIKLESVLDSGDNTMVRDAGLAGTSDWIIGLKAIHDAQNNVGDPFLSVALGYDPTNQAGVDKIGQAFFNTDPDFQLPYVKGGTWFAEYFTSGSYEFGIEIVLEEGEFQPDFDYARKPFHEVDITGLSDATAADKLIKQGKQEEILNYIDPAAFYGMHVDCGKVKDPSNTWSAMDIYTNVVDKFFTKNRFYVDIRNENGLSYNFYNHYEGQIGDPDFGLDFRWGVVSGSLVADFYRTFKWPLKWKDTAHTTTDPTNPLILSLRGDDNLKPILYIESGTVTSATAPPRFVEGDDLLDNPGDLWTDEIFTEHLNVDDPGSPGDKLPIAGVLKLHYSRQIDPATTWTTPPVDNVVRTTHYTDNVFGPLSLEPLWDTDQRISWLGIQDKKYIDGTTLGFGYVAERGVSFDGFDSGNPAVGRTIFYSVADDYFKNAGAFTSLNGITGGVSSAGTFFEVASFFRDFKLQFDVLDITGTKVTVLNIVPGPTTQPINPNSILVLGISKSEYEDLKNLTAGFSDQHPRTVLLEKINDLTDDNAKPYTTYKLKVQGLDPNAKYFFDEPATQITVYTTDQLFFSSDAFTQDEPLPTTYVRNYEEGLGLQSNGFSREIAIRDANSGTNTFEIDNVDLTPELTKHDTIEITSGPNMGTHQVLSVTYAGGADPHTKVVIDAPGFGSNSKAGMFKYLDKPLEEHMINLDQLGALLGAPNEMRSIVDAFETDIDNVVNDANAKANIIGHIDNYANQILTRARAICQDSMNAYADDRILYWARNKMTVILKSHELLLESLLDRNELIKRWEIKSRGMDSISWAGTPAGAQRVLLSGFDPFQMNDASGQNRYQSNPSGALALALHGQTIFDGATPVAYIQTAMFPVRYRDFDERGGEGIVEDFFTQFIDPTDTNYTPTDMVITGSQALIGQFWIDRFAGRNRNSGDDNEARFVEFPDVPTGDQYYETNLPFDKMATGTNPAAIGPEPYDKDDFRVYYNQQFTYTDVASGGRVSYTSLPDSIKKLEAAPVTALTTTGGAPQIGPLAADQTMIISEEGSGGSYLSNEIHYRVSRIRTLTNSSLPTGHLHVPQMQTSNGGIGNGFQTTINFSANNTKAFIEKSIELIKNANTP